MSLTNRVLSGAVKTYKVCETDFLGVRPTVVCKDGFKISIQAGRGYSCTPEDDNGPYTHVELGYPIYPSKLMLNIIKRIGIPLTEPIIAPYAVDKSRLTDTIYKQVPVEATDALLAKHGGPVAFEGECIACTCVEEGVEECLFCQEVVII